MSVSQAKMPRDHAAGDPIELGAERTGLGWPRYELPAILLLGHKTYFAAQDNSAQFWAWYQKASAVLHSGALPLWDANTLAGHSFVGEAQTGVFYPLNIVWLTVLGGTHGIGTRRLDMLIELHVLLASLGFYALARSFSVARLPAGIAAVTFAYTGVVFARTTAQTAIFFGLALVPWAVFFAHRQLETGRLRFGAAAGASIGMGVLAGHFEPPFHAAMFVLLLYVLARVDAPASRRAELLVRARGLALTLAVAGLVALPQLVYTLPYLSRAYRFTGAAAPIPPGGKVSFKEFSELYSGGPESLLSALDPQRFSVPDNNELFIGLAALAALLAAGTAVRGSIRTQLGRYGRPVGAAAAIGALAILGPWTIFPRILYALPLVAQIRELGRYSIMVHLVLCLILALTLQAIGGDWRRHNERRSRGREQLIAGVGAFLVIDGIYLVVEHAPGSSGWFGVQLMLGGLVLLILVVRARLGRVPLIGLLGPLIVAASLHNGTRTLGDTASPLYPPHYFARTPAITYAESACAGHRTLLLDEVLPRNIGDVFPGLRTQNGYGATLQSPFFDFISGSSWTSLEQTRLLDLRCIVARNPLVVAGYRAGFRDTSHGVTVYVDNHTSPLNTPQLQPLPVAILKDDDRHKRYQLNLLHPTAVILSAIVYPGWHLQVDGRPAKSGSFRIGRTSVFPEFSVAPGRHIVEYSWSGWPA
jgi:hypothetical protein